MGPAPTALVWFRRDLRLADHPALTGAAGTAQRLVPVFVLDPALLESRHRSENRIAFMLGCLAALREGLRARGSDLVVRRGDPVAVLAALAAEVGAEAVWWTSDVSPFARRRDRAVREALHAAGIAARPQSGNYVADPSRQPAQRVFSPFERAWRGQERRAILPAPGALPPLPAGLERGALPLVVDPLPVPIALPGEPAGRAVLERALAEVVTAYGETRDLAPRESTTLSPHLRWGTVSAREVEQRLLERGGRGAAALRRQLAWRDFCAHLLLKHPDCLRDGLVPRRQRWSADPAALAAWREGRTGYPLVDAGMRQLAAQGWMHNRARMVTASFLVHDLHADWRVGEAHFARLLYDAEPAQNSLNWQWVAGVGADQGSYLRVFNPTAQAQVVDPDGAYIRRWVPELAALPTELLRTPWTLSRAAQEAYGVQVDRDYPAPIVDHTAARALAVARWEAAA